MHTPPDPDPTRPPDGQPPAGHGSTHDYQPAPPGVHGSSLVQLFGSSFLRPAPANTDDAPTVITPPKPPGAAPPGVAGQRLGHFELIEAIGAGGMATVLKARDLELGRVVALKVLPPETTRDPEAVTRFKQEARAAAKLDHDNVARVYFCGEDRGLHFIAFEFVEGENLRQRIDRAGPLTPAEAVRSMLHVAAGLAHAADRGVVHRDIKPSNILLTPDGRAKIVDMGLARYLESPSVNGGLTQSGVTLGTFDYISPEQALDPRRADVRSDIYSLGCAFYHALTGRPPVPEGTAAKKLHAHQHDSPIDPRDLNPAVPDALALVLGRMMAKDPARRYQTPADLIRDLSAVAHDLGLPADGSVVDTGLLPVLPAAAPADPPRLPVGVLVGVAAAAVAAAVLLGMPAGPSPSAPPWKDPPGGAKLAPPLTDPVGGSPPSVPPVPPTESAGSPRVVGTAADLAAALRSGETVSIQLQPGTYDLTRLPDGVVFDGRELVIEAQPPTVAADPAGPPVLLIAAGPPGDTRPGALTIRNAHRAALKGVEIRVADPPAEHPAEGDPVGLLFENVERVELESVRVRATPAAGRNRLVGAAVNADGPHPVAVAVRHSLFEAGLPGAGLRVPAWAKADVSETAFAPHAAAVELDAGDADRPADAPAGELRLRSCTFLLDRGGSAVAADPGVACRVAAAGCVFAATLPADDRDMMPGADDRDAKPVVLRLADADATGGTTRFEATAGPPNAYYHADALAVGPRHLSFAEAQGLNLPTPPATDPTAITLSRPPWLVPPARRLPEADPWSAFRLNFQAQRKLWVGSTTVVLGAKEILAPDGRPTTIYAGSVSAWPPPRPQLPVKAGPMQRVVFRDAEPEDARDGVYPSFDRAFAELGPGEELVVAVNGRVPVPPLPEKPGLRARVVGHPDYAPVLVPEGAARLRDAPLFLLTDGELSFERVQFLLADRQAVVRMAGGKACSFRDCVITLDGKDDEPAAAVVLPDPSREMRAGADDADGPRVEFQNTLVRGKGRAVVWAQAPRPFRLVAEQTAAVVDGTFLLVEPGGRDGGSSPPRAAVRLFRVTTVLGGPLLDVRAAGPGAAPPAAPAVDADHCLFAPLDRRAAKPLVRVEGPDAAADPKAFFSWLSTGPNVYANADRAALLELRPAASDGPPTEWTADRWRSLVGESGRSAAVRFDGSPLRLRPREVVPTDLRAEDVTTREPIDAGVDPRRLPKPAE